MVAGENPARNRRSQPDRRRRARRIVEVELEARTPEIRRTAQRRQIPRLDRRRRVGGDAQVDRRRRAERAIRKTHQRGRRGRFAADHVETPFADAVVL